MVTVTTRQLWWCRGKAPRYLGTHRDERSLLHGQAKEGRPSCGMALGREGVEQGHDAFGQGT